MNGLQQKQLLPMFFRSSWLNISNCKISSFSSSHVEVYSCTFQAQILCPPSFVYLDIAAELKTGAKTSQDNSGSRLRKIKPFKLQDAAKRLTSKEIKDLLHITYRRILKSDSKSNTNF